MAQYVKNRWQASEVQEAKTQAQAPIRCWDHMHFPNLIRVSQQKNVTLPKSLRSIAATAKIPTHLFNESCATNHAAEWDSQAC